MKVKLFKNNFFINMMFFISLITALFCVFMASFKYDISFQCWIIPAIYVIFFVPSIYNSDIFSFEHPGIFTLNIFLFARYVILPFAIYATGEKAIDVRNYDYMNKAIFIMAYEEIFILLTMLFLNKKNKHKNINVDSKNSVFINHFLSYKFIFIIVFFVLIFFIFKYPYFIGGIKLIFKSSATNRFDSPDSLPFLTTIWHVLSTWIYIYIFFSFKKSNSNSLNNKSIFSIIFVSVFFIALTFIGQDGIHRWYTMVSFASIFFMLIKFYKNKKKQIFSCICLPVILFFVIVSMLKTANYNFNGDISFKNAFFDLIDVPTLDAYLAGPYNVNTAYGLYKEWNLDFSIMKNDIVTSIPFVHHFISCYPVSRDLFNMYAGTWFGKLGGYLIIPLIGQSIIYFSPLFAPLLSIISVFLVYFFDKKFNESCEMLTYVYAFTSIWFSTATILNITIQISWIFTEIIPMILFIKVIDIFAKKIRLSFRRRSNY